MRDGLRSGSEASFGGGSKPPIECASTLNRGASLHSQLTTGVSAAEWGMLAATREERHYKAAEGSRQKDDYTELAVVSRRRRLGRARRRRLGRSRHTFGCRSALGSLHGKARARFAIVENGCHRVIARSKRLQERGAQRHLDASGLRRIVRGIHRLPIHRDAGEVGESRLVVDVAREGEPESLRAAQCLRSAVAFRREVRDVEFGNGLLDAG